MTRDNAMPAAPSGRIESLALALATGSTVRVWCMANEVSERTAYGWSAKPEFKARVASLRSALVDRALGRLSRSANKAVRALERIVGPRSASNDAVKVQAAKAILAALISVQNQTELTTRVAELEERFELLATKNGKGT